VHAVSGDVVALLLIGAVHLVAVAVIVFPLARAAPDGEDPESQGGSDDDGGGGSRRPEVGPTRPRPRGDLPLPDAAPARLRLRGAGRLADSYDWPRRREPSPARHVRR
jgi:hypothetical protein